MAGPVTFEVQRGVPPPTNVPTRGIPTGLTEALRRLRTRDESVWIPAAVCGRRTVACAIHGVRRSLRATGQPLASFVQRTSPAGTRVWRRA